MQVSDNIHPSCILLQPDLWFPIIDLIMDRTDSTDLRRMSRRRSSAINQVAIGPDYLINQTTYRQKSAGDIELPSHLRTSVDGETILIPQPSDHPDDPLNWSWRKKHSVLFALAVPALLTDWGMTWGSPLFPAQAATWHMSIPEVANSISGGIFMQGAGGVLAVPLVQKYGR